MSIMLVFEEEVIVIGVKYTYRSQVGRSDNEKDKFYEEVTCG